MILFLYGDDSYRSKQKLDAIKVKYIDASLGDTNLAVLDFEDKTITYDKIVREILALPFLAKSRLVVLRNLFSRSKKELQEKIIELLPKIPNSTNLIVYEEGIPDKRTALFKYLAKPKTSQEFKPFQGYELEKWVENEVKNQGASIEPAAKSKLIEYVGNDLWRIENEIKKLASYVFDARLLQKDVHSIGASANKRSSNGSSDPLFTSKLACIRVLDVELLVKPKIESNVFALVDAIGQKDSKKALESLNNLISSGENELYILTMIVYQFRNLLMVKDEIENYKSDDYLKISKKVKIHPYVVKKTIFASKKFTLCELKTIYYNLFRYDYLIKTGQIEPRIAIYLVVSELCV